MPTIPTYTKCSELGCNNPKGHKSSLCIEHQSAKQRYIRPIPKDRCAHGGMYNTRYWAKLRQTQLSTHPLCAGCLSEGIVTSAKHIDHVFPWTFIGEQAFIRNIFQSLCHSCHSSKTHLEQKGVFRMYGTPNIDYTLADYTRVVVDAFK